MHKANKKVLKGWLKIFTSYGYSEFRQEISQNSAANACIGQYRYMTLGILYGRTMQWDWLTALISFYRYEEWSPKVSE